MSDEVTVFEVYGPMAMFRKPYTTTSSVSFAFPPPTAVAGMIAAIVGIDNGSKEDASNASYWSSMAGSRIAVGIASKINWMHHSVNFMNTKTSGRIRVKHQFLHSPRYRIYVTGTLQERLRTFVASSSFIYTPYLGTAYAIAQLDYVGTFPWRPMQAGEVAVNTVVPWSSDLRVDVLQSKGMFRETVPFRLDQKRAMLEAKDVLYQTSPCHKIHLRERGGLDVTRCGNGDVVAWFPEW